MLLSYSKIPNEFLKPLNIETGIEYTIDSDKFPGIEEVNGEPTLVLANREDSSAEYSNAEDFQPRFTNFKVPNGIPGELDQPGQNDQGNLDDKCCPSGVQRRLTFETPTRDKNQRSYTSDKNPTRLEATALPPAPSVFLPRSQTSQVLSCLDPFDDGFSTTRNDGTSVDFTAASANPHGAAGTSLHDSHWSTGKLTTNHLVLPSYNQQLSDHFRRRHVPARRVQRAQVSVYGVEASATFTQDLPVPPQHRTTGFRGKSLPEKRPLPEDTPEEEFDEYSCPPKRPTLPCHPSKRHHTIHYRGENSFVRKPAVSHTPIIRRKEPNIPPPNVDISKLLLRTSSTKLQPGNHIVPQNNAINRPASFSETRSQNPTCSAVNVPPSFHETSQNSTCSRASLLPSFYETRGQNPTCSTVNLPPNFHKTRGQNPTCSTVNLPPNLPETRSQNPMCPTVNLPSIFHHDISQNANQPTNNCAANLQTSNVTNNNCITSQQTSCLPINTCVTTDSFLDVLRARWSSPVE